MPAWSGPMVRRVASAVCGARHPEQPQYWCCRWPHTIEDGHGAFVELDDDEWVEIEWPASEDSPGCVVDVPAGKYL